MSDLTRRTKDAKIGSNLKARKRLAAADAALLERRVEPLQRGEQAFVRRRRQLLTKPVVGKMSAVFEQQRAAYLQAFAKANGNADAIRKARARTRASIDRSLRASIPKYAEFEAMRERHARETRGLVDAHLIGPAVGLDFQLGEVGLTGGVPFQLFKAPYELFDVIPVNPNNHSLAQPRTGLVVIDLEGHHNQSSFLDMSFSPHTAIGEFRSAVGVNFRVPQTGFLTGTAVVHNLLNQFFLTLRDNFGLSYGELHLVHTIFITIIRSGEITRFERTMIADGLISHGSDLFREVPPIQKFTPFTVSFTTKDAFLKGEQIQILAGTAVLTRDYLDDMDSTFRALTLWQVKSMSIGMQT